jgi:hypothetical protein
MLCQLVCTDRRYARMNCFNIRELQGILKRRFFTDLVNSHDHRNILSNAMIGLKHKFHNNENINLDTIMFYNWGILKNQSSKLINFDRNNELFIRSYISFLNFIFIELFNFILTLNSLFFTLILSVFNLFNLFNFKSIFYTFFYLIHSVLSTFFLNISYVIFLNFSMFKLETIYFNLKLYINYIKHNDNSFFFPKDTNITNLITDFSFVESSSSQRLTRFSSSLIGYDYKTGHYLGLSEKLYPQLIISFIEVARGIRKPT